MVGLVDIRGVDIEVFGSEIGRYFFAFIEKRGGGNNCSVGFGQALGNAPAVFAFSAGN